MTQRDQGESVCQNDTSLLSLLLITPASLKIKEGPSQSLISSRSTTKRYFVQLCSFCTKNQQPESGRWKNGGLAIHAKAEKGSSCDPKIYNHCTLVHLPTVTAAEPTLSALLSCQHRALNPTNKIFPHLPPAHISTYYKSCCELKCLCCESLRFAADPIYLSIYSRKQRISTSILAHYMPALCNSL